MDDFDAVEYFNPVHARARLEAEGRTPEVMEQLMEIYKVIYSRPKEEIIAAYKKYVAP